MSEDFKPKWIKWSQEDFELACYKMGLTKTQRDMYRCLLMACYFGKDRPYIPDDPEQLWRLAEANSLKHWEKNCQPFLGDKFEEVTRENGDEMLQNPRAMREWEDLRDKLQQQKNAGALGVAARVNAKKRKTTKDKTTEDETTPPKTRLERSTNGERTVTKRSAWEGGAGAKVKSTSKSKAKSGQGIDELWTALQVAFDAVFGKQNVGYAHSLKKTGLDAVRDFIAAGTYPQQEVMDAWTHWLVNKYQDSLNDDVPIKFPLSVFATDAAAQIYNLRKENAEIAEPVTNAELEVIESE